VERVEPADRIGDLAVEVPQHELGGVDQFDIALSSAVHFGLRYQLGVRGHPDRLVDDVHQRAQAARYPVHRVPLRQHAFAVAGYQQHRLGALGPGEGAGDGRSAGSPRRRYREQPGRHDGRDPAGGRPSRLDLRHRPHHFDGAATDPPAQRLPRPRHVPEPAQDRADLHKYRSRRGTSQPLFRSQHPYAARWWSGCSHFFPRPARGCRRSVTPLAVSVPMAVRVLSRRESVPDRRPGAAMPTLVLDGGNSPALCTPARTRWAPC
jgi:hypothetical protein